MGDHGRFVVFRCRNKKILHGVESECQQKVGGPELDSLLRHGFDRGPYESVHFCPKCGWIKLSIASMKTVPRTEIIGKGQGVHVDMVDPGEVFAFTETVVG